MQIFTKKMDRKKLDPDQAETRAVSRYDYWLKEYKKNIWSAICKKAEKLIFEK